MASPMVVHGLKETQARMTQALKDLNGTPVENAMRDSVLLVQRDARKNSPVFSGQLRASILPEVTTQGSIFGGSQVIGVVGSNVEYAAAMEKGTRPHWPPLAALEVWARRHGMTAFLVARAIARRGLKPRRFLENALDSNREKIKQKFNHTVSMIVRVANGG